MAAQPLPTTLQVLVPIQHLAPAFAPQDPQDPSGTKVTAYQTDLDHWSNTVFAQIGVLNPAWQTNIQWPAGLPVASNLAA
jgi:hypothetical protein